MATKVTDLFEPEECGNVRIEVTSSPLTEREGNRFHRKAYTIALINTETGEPVVGEISRMMPIQALLSDYSEGTVRWLLADQISLVEEDVPFEDIQSFIDSLEFREN
jgi:hypothetical protein